VRKKKIKLLTDDAIALKVVGRCIGGGKEGSRRLLGSWTRRKSMTIHLCEGTFTIHVVIVKGATRELLFEEARLHALQFVLGR
jgi:hypothetical protein